MCPVEVNKIKASILVIGFQKEGRRMYPHLHDVIEHLRTIYTDVQYIEDDDCGYGLYLIDRIICDICNGNKLRILPLNILRLIKRCYLYIIKRKTFIRRIKGIKLKHKGMLILAIDHHASALAEKYFPGRVVLWSYNIIAKDHPWRIRGGFLEKLITSEHARRIRALIVQDEDRKELLNETIGVKFQHTVFLPVSLTDFEFCRKESQKREKRDSFSEVNVIQSGWIVEGRWSCDLIESYQRWPDYYRLKLHGVMDDRVRNKIGEVKRKPQVSRTRYDNIGLLQMLNEHDIGFVGYKEGDSNHRYIKNSSGQTVEFLRLGIPVIGSGSAIFNDYVNSHNIGMGVATIEGIEEVIKRIIDNYSFFSQNARKVYESKFNLDIFFSDYINSSMFRLFDMMLKGKKKL